MLVPLNITGGTYRHRSLPVSAQTTRNFWPQKIDAANAKSTYILSAFPGLKLFGAASGGADRGMLEHRGLLYKVTGQTLYQVVDGGSHTALGVLPGVARCVMEGIGDSVVIVSDKRAFVWNGATITEVTDADLEQPNACAHINNQMVYDGEGGRWCVSDVGAPGTINGLNYATAESNADDLIRPYVYGQTLFLMGEKTIEQWYNSGTGNPPFERHSGLTLNVGLGALHAVASDEGGILFLGHDSHVYYIVGNSLKEVSTSALVQAFTGYETIRDCVVWSAKIDGHSLFFLTFPNDDKTWVYEVGGDWFELSSGKTGGRSYANSYAFAFRKHLLADHRNGNIYMLSPTTFTDNGESVIRVRDTAPLHGGLAGKPGKALTMNSFELFLEAGVGLPAGQGFNPAVMLSFSDDGGRSFSSELWGTVGRLGAFQWKISWHALGQFYERILRVKTSDPVKYVIMDAAADVEVGV